jgi:DNA-directed RNA polymerase specialized sigma24 family protein
VSASGRRAALTADERRILEEMYRELGPVVWRIVFTWTGGDREVADEAVAEAFARAGCYLGGIRDPRRWLITTALNVAKVELGRRQTVVPSGQSAPGPAGLGGDGELVGVEMAQVLRALPLTQRTAFVLRDVFGFPVADIAAMTGRSGTAVRVHAHRARLKLRELLRESE